MTPDETFELFEAVGYLAGQRSASAQDLLNLSAYLFTRALNELPRAERQATLRHWLAYAKDLDELTTPTSHEPYFDRRRH